MKKLYVGNLPYSATEESLKSLFSQFGHIDSAVIIKDRETGRSKGFGFIEFATPEEAKTAAAELDGKEFEGRTLKVNMAMPKSSGGTKGSGGHGGGNRW